PSVELDRLNLGTGIDLAGGAHIKIILGAAVLLRNRFEPDDQVEFLAARRMLAVALEKALALAATEQVEQSPVEKRKHRRRRDLVIKRRRSDADLGLVVSRLGRPRHHRRTPRR